jgi:hypothetical protein
VPDLILGPLLRYTGKSDATIWVETDADCEVEVRVEEAVHRSQTFRIEDHHYALIHVSGLTSDAVYEYSVDLDGVQAWPEPDSAFPPSIIRTLGEKEPFRIAFGSCRAAGPPDTTMFGKRDEGDIDALDALATRMSNEPLEYWPDALLLLGDQIYADEVSPETLEYIRSRRDTKKPPGKEVANFEEYTRLYWESWGDPVIRWLLSTVTSAMIFDDHDVNDDWNTSEAWVERMRTKPWWNDRITGGFMSYWIYQHIGNLSPEELDKNELFHRVKEADNAGPILRDFAYKADRDVSEVRWSFHRDFGKSRLIVVDSRAGRILKEGERRMVDDEEWEWVQQKATGDFDHLLIGTSLPLILAPALHHTESWNEAVCAGAWGKTAARIGESFRQAVDLEQWPAFRKSFDGFIELLRSVSAGERGPAPNSITVLSGDVHHTYLAEIDLPAPNSGSRVYQATCSPFRKSMPRALRSIFDWAWTGEGTFIPHLLARAAGVESPRASWHLTHDKPWFENHVAILTLEGPENTLEIEKAVWKRAEGDRIATLRRIFTHKLSSREPIHDHRR